MSFCYQCDEDERCRCGDRDFAALRAAVEAVLAIDAEEHATGSRDFGRGFTHAMRLVRERLDPVMKDI
jgi:hypothetical protein